MTGRKTLEEVREQIAAARAAGLSATDSAEAQETLEALERLADELDPAQDGRREGEPSSRGPAGRTRHST